jgi:hypothetical protein
MTRNVRTPSLKRKTYKLFDGGGLYLEVMPAGGKLWRLKYRFGSKEKRLSFEGYPIISLKDARDKRDDAKLLLASNVDPAISKQEEKITSHINASNTFEAIAREWIEKRKGEISQKTLDTIQRRLENNLFPRIGKLPIKSINAPILLDALNVFYPLKLRSFYGCSPLFKRGCPLFINLNLHG